MKPVVRIGMVMAGVLLAAGVQEAAAQMLQSADRVFAGVSFGQQTKARTLTISGSSSLYDETATFESTVGVGAERIVDIEAGVRVWSNLAVGGGWSRYTDTSSSTLNASIPDPLFFDTFVARSTTAEGLEREETQIRLSAFWIQPVTDKFDVILYGGPSFFSVKQDVLSGFTVATNTTNLSGVTQTTIDESTTGFHGGVDLRYLIIKNAGVGVFARYSSASVDSDVVEGGKIEMGGFQYGFGLRLRF